MNGSHWMFTPFREMLIVHAVRQPLAAPSFTKPVVSRSVAATYALLSDTITFNRASSARIDVLAAWGDPYDDGVSATGDVILEQTSRVGELPAELGLPTPSTIAMADLRHDFGDTKHREVFYTAVATSRFLEFFTEQDQVTLTGTTAAAVSPHGFAVGATTVTGTGSAASVAYVQDTDFVTDDVHGTVARTATSAIASGASVEVQYVVPPVTRSSIEHPVAPNTKVGYPLSIPSSARPSTPDVRYVLPAFRWSAGSNSKSVSSARFGGALRVYLGRPWFSSGAGELLGVVVLSPLGPSGTGEVVRRPRSDEYQPFQPYFTVAGRDPLFQGAPVGSILYATDFPLAKATATDLTLAELTTGIGTIASVAGHEVQFDPTRNLWFADVEISSLSSSYWPMVSLTFARYQPHSLTGCELSRVVQAGFAQLAPDRAATLTFIEAGGKSIIRVVISGPGYAEGPSGNTSVMRAYLEVEAPHITDDDLKWVPAYPKSPFVELETILGDASSTSWAGDVDLPGPRGSRPFRLRFEESEVYSSSSFRGGPVDRVTYMDCIEF